MHLTKDQLEMISELRNGLGVLQEISSHRIPEEAQRGTVLVSCADGDRVDDIFGFHKKCHAHGRHHLLTAAGGPVTGVWGTGNLLAEEIDIARRVKAIETIVLVAHLPCAMAWSQGMTIPAILDALFERKSWVKQHFPIYGHKKGGVVCHVHVDDGKKMRTYHACKDAWYRCKDQFS